MPLPRRPFTRPMRPAGRPARGWAWPVVVGLGVVWLGTALALLPGAALARIDLPRAALRVETGPDALIAAALARGLAATVELYTDTGAPAFLGSGFLFGTEPVLVTNAHVIGAHAHIVARFSDGQRREATLLRQDRARDLALFTLTGPAPAPGLSPAPTAPVLGQPLFALGAPLELGQSVTRGSLSHVGRQVDPAVPLQLYQHDAALNPGSSGGPLLDARGGVVAINARIADGSRFFTGVAYAVPVATLQGLIDDTLVPVPRLGLRLRPLDGETARLLGLGEDQTGVLVDDVDDGGAAARAGLRPGDVLLSLDGRRLDRPGTLAFALEGRRSDTLPLVLMRPGAHPMEQQLTLRLTPTDMPEASAASRAAPAPVPLGLTLAPGTARILSVTENSPAFAAGLAPGDEIRAVNGLAGAKVALRSATAQLLRIQRDERQMHLLLDPAAAPSLGRPVTGNALDPAVVPF
ncbi:S1C family serine protease [Pseudooceanicola marinus]|uniref:S1C family serine protease n=1 Tax=Pseudooceanicola marinus TaxID=396013 RepID=UPI001CD45DE8|nr:trypsin-like peptidase domain-containing protein [Pseudooceanicola marinus]MCA1335228.1 trypsin-like peptidase domain-containing protein [Pseudooceanicola marinus]